MLLVRRAAGRGAPLRVGATRRAQRGFTRISETASFVKEADREIYLVGTAHVSKDSANEVRELIELVRPDYVAVELCEQREQRLRALLSDWDKPHNCAESLAAVLSAFGHHGPLGGVFAVLNEVMRNTGLVPGIDFKTALDAADEVGAKVVLIDRNIDETMRLLREAIPKLSLRKILTTPDPPELVKAREAVSGDGGIKAKIEGLKQREHLVLLKKHMANVAGPVQEVMVDQRDRYMLQQLREQCPRGKVVAVVGMAHMDGIENEWRKSAKPAPKA